ncbi:extracellular serine-rich protein [Phlyctema vagabunda]|uniref:Extracellular serine-rich protein n=1 Tax=Phlyctema vagabunda TaxID=108571 RepID=A0ABR4PD57_9HELO
MISPALLLLPALPYALAQSGSTTAPSSVQTVAVGEDGLVFTPSSITADVGSQVEFVFYPQAHSVAQSSFDTPCAPLGTDAFFSGGIVTSGSGPNSETFTITINDTAPIFFYCAAGKHCQAGMAGVINPPSNTSETLELYIAAGKDVDSTTVPAAVQGGVLGSAAAANSATPSASTSSSASATAATATPTSGAMPGLEARSLWLCMGLAACAIGLVL